MWVGSLMYKINLNHPDLIKQILKSTEPKPHTMGTTYSAGLDWLGDSLLVTNGAKWSRNRRLLTPAFHFDILKTYIQVKNEAVDILLNKIQNCVDRGRSFELFEFISLCTLDVLLGCAFSYTNDIQTLGEKHPYIKAVNELGDAWMNRLLNPLLFPSFVFNLTSQGRKFAKNCKHVHEFTEDIIRRRKQEMEWKAGVNDKGKYLDFLDILLKARDDDGVGLSDREIRDEADTFMFAGHDTTTCALSWTLYSLAIHPECQQRVQEEVDEIYAEKDTEYITTNDLQKMKYLTMCLKESLRLHSPVPYLQRVTTKEFELDGYTIPRGASIGLQLLYLHHNPTVWEDPTEFRPERFTTENIQGRDAFAFLPFSAGPRNCIGQNFAMHEMKIFLSRILHKYTITLDSSVPVLRKLSIVMTTANGIHVFAVPRQEIVS